MKHKKLIIFYIGSILCILGLIGYSIGQPAPGSIHSVSDVKTSECNRIYDVSRNGIISRHDAEMCWRYITDPEHHCWEGDLLFDVNCDGRVNFQDCGLIYIHREID